MEEDPIHWDPEVARQRGHDDVVAPPLYLLHIFRRPVGSDDPLDRLQSDPGWDGTDSAGWGLPMPDVGLNRILNGGTEAEFFRLPQVGDVISAQTEYADIVERDGRSGPMVLVTLATVFTNQDDALMATIRTTGILR
jgi:acyl dehydratase